VKLLRDGETLRGAGYCETELAVRNVVIRGDWMAIDQHASTGDIV
jgi:hypothetical protein